MRSALGVTRARGALRSVVAGLVGLALLTTAGVEAQVQVQPVGATAQLRDTAGRLVANAELREGRGEVLITINFANPPVLSGTHGLRLFEVGRCDAPDFLSAGNGFNPTGKPHGRQNPDGPQVGDLPNVNFTTGLTSYNTSANGATLGPGPNSLLGPNRTALIVTANPDDQVTDPDGKAGARVACGVVVPSAAALAQQPAAAGQAAQPQPLFPGQLPSPQPSSVPLVSASPSPVQVPAASQAQAVPQSPPQAAPAAQGQGQFPQQLPPSSPKPVASPSAYVPPTPQILQVPSVVAKPGAAQASPVVGSPVAVSSVAPPAPIIAVPTTVVAGAQTSTSSQTLGVGPALLISIAGVGLIAAGYLLRRRNQLTP